MKIIKGEAPNTLTRRAMHKVQPLLYRTAPNKDVDGFKRHIMDFEARRRNTKTLEEAREIFRMLQLMSHGKGPDEAYILRDPLTGLWRGAETPTIKESYGLETTGKRAEKSKDSFRSRYGKVTARSREDFLLLIQQTETCERGRAEQIFVTMATNKSVIPPILRDNPTNTWRGFLSPTPSMDDVIAEGPTTKQAYYWKLFHEMPWLKHDQRKLEESDAIPWVIQAAAAERDDARKLIDRAWNCSKDKKKIPLQFRTLDGVKQIGGKGYVEPFRLTGEAREKLLNMPPVIDEDGHDDEIDNSIMAATGCDKSQADKVIALAEEEELLARETLTNSKGREHNCICGKKWLEDYLAKRRAKKLAEEAESRHKKAEEETRLESERKQRESEPPFPFWPHRDTVTDENFLELITLNVLFKGLGNGDAIYSTDLEDFKLRVTQAEQYYEVPFAGDDGAPLVDYLVSKGVVCKRLQAKQKRGPLKLEEAWTLADD